MLDPLAETKAPKNKKKTEDEEEHLTLLQQGTMYIENHEMKKERKFSCNLSPLLLSDWKNLLQSKTQFIDHYLEEN